jgi:uncharacterized protein YifN (PemK superfamily)
MSFWQLSPKRVVVVVDELVVVSFVVVEVVDVVVVDVVVGGMQHPLESHVQLMLGMYLSLQSWAVAQMTLFVQLPPIAGHTQHGPYLE